MLCTAPLQLEPFLRRTDILVCLLPLTPETRHILERGLFEKLNRNSPLGAPVLINAGRGGLQNEADILRCLDDGTLGAVSFDVFAAEPLPADSPFWTHPKVVLTPHNAADTDPDAISGYVARADRTLRGRRRAGKRRRSRARVLAEPGEKARLQNGLSPSPGTSAGLGPGAAQRKRRSASAMAISLMLASRRRIRPESSNSHCSLP